MTRLRDFSQGFRKGMKEFGYTVTTIVNTLLLTIAYFFGIGLTSLFAKIVRKRFLELKLSEKETYWDDLNLKKKPIEDHYRQF